MKSIFRVVLMMSLVFGLFATSPIQPASARSNERQTSPAMPAGLQDAFLSASAQPFTRQGATYTSQRNGLTTTLSASGLQSAGSLQWGLALHSLGRVNQGMEVEPPQIVEENGQLTYRRGDLSEWYRNTALGVEQGFTISQAPGGSGRLTLSLDLFTSLSGSLDENGRGISFSGSADGQTLRYDHLAAFDAHGQELPAKMLLGASQVQIQVDDRAAAYPLTIDPLVYIEQKVIALDGTANDHFGISVAISGDTALVGASGDTVAGNIYEGSAWVFIRSGSIWSPQAQLIAPDGTAGEYFGWSVALSGDTALVGAPYATVDANTAQGAAYVFTRSSSSWSPQAKLTASDGVAGDGFGSAVALDGDTALVGAPYQQGSTYVFSRSASNWTQQAKFTASNPSASDFFGNSVSLSGDTALVGAIYENAGGIIDQGAAYVYLRSNDVWALQQRLIAADGLAGDYFGSSVALSGDTALVGAKGDDGTYTDQGSAYVFLRSGSSWSQQQKLVSATPAMSDDFGSAVALAGDTALVGATGGSGSATLFTRSGSSWTQQQVLTASDARSNDYFGYSVAISGDTALVGSIFSDMGANIDQGAAYFYQPYRTDSDLAINASASRTSVQAGEPLFITVSVTNLSAAAAASVSAVALLPAGLTLSGEAPTLGSYDPLSGVWQIGSLPAYTSASLSLQVSANSGYGTALVFSPHLTAWDTNNSNNSTSLTITLLPAAPSGLTPNIVNATSIRLDWTDNATDETETSIERTLNGLPTPAWNQIGRSGMNTSTFTDSGVTCGVDYSYRVRAFRSSDGAYSAYSNIANISTAPCAPVVSITPSSRDFGNVKIGQTASQDFTLANTGNADLIIGAISISGLNSDSFRWGANTCNNIQTPGSICTMTVTFAPITTGSLSAEIKIASNSASSPDSVSLTGHGLSERLLNGGFNTYSGTSKIPTYWAKSLNFSLTDGKDTTAANRHEGTASVRIGNTTALVKTLTQTLSTLGGSAGDPFIFSYWVKGSSLPSTGLCQAQVLFYNGTTLNGSKTLPCGSSGSFAYQLRTLSFTAPANYTKVLVRFTYAKASGTAWFDGASLLR